MKQLIIFTQKSKDLKVNKIMNLEDIKEIIKKDNGKFIIVEDGEPVMVIISWGEYQKVLDLRENPVEERTAKLPEFSVPEMPEFEEDDSDSEPSSEAKKESSSDEDENSENPSDFDGGEEDKDEPLKIEDLPF